MFILPYVCAFFFPVCIHRWLALAHPPRGTLQRRHYYYVRRYNLNNNFFSSITFSPARARNNTDVTIITVSANPFRRVIRCIIYNTRVIINTHYNIMLYRTGQFFFPDLLCSPDERKTKFHAA